jgi:hypothetical protein
VLSGSRPWLAVEAVLLLFFATYLVLHHIQIHDDCAGYIMEARLLLEGQVPYVDSVEVNPPWIIYLNLPPVYLAKFLGLPATLTFNLYVASLLMLSVWEIRYFLRRSVLKLEPAEIGVISLTWIAAYLAAYWCDQFGQREHLFVLFYMPFLFARVVRYEGQVLPRWIWIVMGIQAGVGACNKPHFAAIVAAVEIVQWARHRRLRLPAFACYDAWLRDGQKGPYGSYHRSLDSTSLEEKRFLAELADDVRTRAPRVIAVYNRPNCQGCPDELNLHEYLEHAGLLDVMRQQGYSEVTDPHSEYRVYLAKPRSGD